MGHKVKQALMSSRIDFFYYAFRNVLSVSVPLLTFSVFIFTTPHSSAEISSGTDNVQLVLSTSCTINAVVTSEHTVSLNGGQLDNNVGNTKLSAFCNDNNGYSIYAVGSSGDIDGNTDLVNTVNESYNIHTGVYDDTAQTNPSSWAMKLTAGTGTGIDPVTGESVPTTPPTILNGYDNYSAIPNVYTQVAKRSSGTSMTTDTSISGSYLNTTYQIYANSAQPAGTYNGKVKYVIVHPNSNNNTIPGLDTAFAVAGKMKVYKEGGNSYYAMQDMDSQICSLVGNSGEVTATQLVDLRDSKLYWVAKLADGHCWMTENLDFDIEANTVLNSNTTDLNVAYNSSTGQYAEYNSGYSQVNDIIYWQPLRGTISFKGTTVSGWQDSYTEPYSANKTDDTNTGHASLGNHYNWTVAIASNNSANASAQNYVTENSICPKGWRLPKTSPYNEFSTLANAYNITTSTNAINLSNPPLYFTRPGFIDYSIYTSNNVGYYWSSTVYNGTDAYRLDFGNNRLDWNSRLKNFGFSVRCVAR